MFKMQERFKAVDGYHVIEIHDKDEVFRQAVIEAMKVKGYDVYGFSDLGDSVQYNFVTAEFAEVLKERHHESCRNSAGGLVNQQFLGRLIPLTPDVQQQLDRLKAMDEPSLVINAPIKHDGQIHTHSGTGSLEPGLGSQIMGTGRLDD